MPLLTTEGIVLKSQSLGEADKLVTLFTVDRGKVRGVAKGARRGRTRYGASLEPFTHLGLVLYERRPGVLLRINQTEILHHFIKIREDLERISAASLMVRLTSLLSPDGEANSGLFGLLLQALSRLEKRNKDTELTSRFFEIQLLKHSGYLPRMDRCLRCQRGIDHVSVYFSPMAGGTVCSSCSKVPREFVEPVSKGTLAFWAQSGRMGWDKLDRMKPTRLIRKELRNLLETSISNVTGRPFPPSMNL